MYEAAVPADWNNMVFPTKKLNNNCDAGGGGDSPSWLRDVGNRCILLGAIWYCYTLVKLSI